MGAFSIGGIMPLVPKYDLPEDDEYFWCPPEVIAQVDGEDCYPQTTAGWGEDALVMVDAPRLRRFSRYWDMMGNSSYHVEEYNLETRTKTTYTVTPDKTEALDDHDLYAIIQLLGKERAEEQFSLRQITPEDGKTAYTFEPAMPPSTEADFVIEDGVLVKYQGQGGDVVVPEDVTRIAPLAFCYIDKPYRVTLPHGITAIEDSTFYSSNLRQITIPDSVTTIGESAFKFCNDLCQITIPDNVTTIGKSAFKFCSKLQEVVIPDSVTSIGQEAFRYCDELTRVTIPQGAAVGDGAFADCPNLTGVDLPESATTAPYIPRTISEEDLPF